MRRLVVLVTAAVLLFPLAPQAITKSKQRSYTSGGVSLSLEGGAGAIYRPGEEVGFSFRTDRDAYVVVFDIDTDGYVHLLYPPRGKVREKALSGRRYAVPSPGDGSLLVSGPRGLELVFALAVPERGLLREEELAFLAESEAEERSEQFRIDGDPFLAANMIAGELVVGIGRNQDISLAYTHFYVDGKVDYPRYICAECHEENLEPYRSPCERYQISADLDEEGSMGYPLRRAFEVARIDEKQHEESNEEQSRIYVHFYPYEVYVYPRFWYSAYWYDPWWPPLWYDPWFYAYPYSSGFYFAWVWDWGWWGWGWDYWGWGGCWYVWDDRYDYSRYRDAYRPLRPRRPRYKSAIVRTALARARRDPDLRIGTVKYKPSRRVAAVRSYGKNRLDGKGVIKSTHRYRSPYQRDRSHFYNWGKKMANKRGPAARKPRWDKRRVRVENPRGRKAPSRGRSKGYVKPRRGKKRGGAESPKMRSGKGQNRSAKAYRHSRSARPTRSRSPANSRRSRGGTRRAKH